jgi:hypothetical protein
MLLSPPHQQFDIVRFIITTTRLIRQGDWTGDWTGCCFAHSFVFGKKEKIDGQMSRVLSATAKVLYP